MHGMITVMVEVMPMTLHDMHEMGLRLRLHGAGLALRDL
jgi:hypothetical protein